jgi:hypothetical protein
MTVIELREQLADLPDDKEVRSKWDGAARTPVTRAYTAKAGHVVLDDGGPTHYEQDQPVDHHTRS